MGELIWVGLIIGIAAYVQSCTGFGFALISIPFLSLLLDIKTSVPLVIFYSFLVSLPLSIMMRQHLCWKSIIFLFLGSLPGTFIGSKILQQARPEYLLISMGVVLIVYCSFELLKKESSIIVFNRFWITVVGFFSGILGGSIGESGPPVVIYTSMQGWSADQIKSTLLCFFSIQMAGIILQYLYDDLYNSRIVDLFLYSLPCFIVGAVFGVLTYKIIKTRQALYKRIIYTTLLCNGTYILIANLVKISSQS